VGPGPSFHRARHARQSRGRGAGAPITLIPIDGASQVTIDAALVEAIWALPGAMPRFAVELLRSLRKTHRRGPFGPPDMPINYPLALLLAGESALARTLPARVDIELAGRFTYGRTVVDFGGKSGVRRHLG
jgi:inosine-uridine nucleoside N-ribohydrolase